MAQVSGPAFGHRLRGRRGPVHTTPLRCRLCKPAISSSPPSSPVWSFLPRPRFASSRCCDRVAMSPQPQGAPVSSLVIPAWGNVSLAARWDTPEHPTQALVFCHPHPLHGGTMTVPLMNGVTDVVVSRGVAVLRFNFRGVEESTGVWSGGIDEIDDIAAAVETARSAYPDLPLSIAGWSFGAATSLRWIAIATTSPGSALHRRSVLSSRPRSHRAKPFRTPPAHSSSVIVTSSSPLKRSARMRPQSMAPFTSSKAATTSSTTATMRSARWWPARSVYRSQTGTERARLDYQSNRAAALWTRTRSTAGSARALSRQAWASVSGSPNG